MMLYTPMSSSARMESLVAFASSNERLTLEENTFMRLKMNALALIYRATCEHGCPTQTSPDGGQPMTNLPPGVASSTGESRHE